VQLHLELTLLHWHLQKTHFEHFTLRGPSPLPGILCTTCISQAGSFLFVYVLATTTLPAGVLRRNVRKVVPSPEGPLLSQLSSAKYPEVRT
jgi:hypothetical protein